MKEREEDEKDSFSDRSSYRGRGNQQKRNELQIRLVKVKHPKQIISLSIIASEAWFISSIQRLSDKNNSSIGYQNRYAY